MTPIQKAYAIGQWMAKVAFEKEARRAFVNPAQKLFQEVRSLAAQGRTNEAITQAHQALSKGNVPAEALERLFLPGAKGVAPLEKKIWEGVRGVRDKNLIDPRLQKSWQQAQQGVKPGTPPVADVAATTPKTQWQHTPEEMRAFGQKTTKKTKDVTTAAPKPAEAPAAATAPKPAEAPAAATAPPPELSVAADPATPRSLWPLLAAGGGGLGLGAAGMHLAHRK